MPRIDLTGPSTFYTSASGNDANDGLTPATPKQTVQAMISEVMANYDLRGKDVVFQHTGVATPFFVRGKFHGQYNMTRFVGVSASITGSNCIMLDSGAEVMAEGWALSAIGSSALNAQMGSRIWYRDIDFGACYGGYHIQTQKQATSFYVSTRADGSKSDYKISGSAYAHIYVNGCSVAYLTETVNANKILISSGVAFDIGFIHAIDNGNIVAHTNAWTGTLASPVAYSRRNSCVDGITALPGAQPTSTAPGTTYCDASSYLG